MIDLMEFEICHPYSREFPEGDYSWSELGLYPIGRIRDEASGRWLPLALDQRRTPFAIVGTDQPIAVHAGLFGPAFAEALAKLGRNLWGHEWNSSIGELFGINPRTTQRDRVTSNLLPPKLIMTIAFIASRENPRGLAEIVRAVARMRAHSDYMEIREACSTAIDVVFERGDFTCGADG